jgi:hypothetical protein
MTFRSCCSGSFLLLPWSAMLNDLFRSPPLADTAAESESSRFAAAQGHDALYRRS